MSCGITFLLVSLTLAGCEKKPEEAVKATSAQAPKSAPASQPVKNSAPKLAPAENANAQYAGVADDAHALSGSADEYSEFHRLFCKQVKGESLSSRESSRLSHLENLDEMFRDDEHMSRYSQAHNPDSCI